MAENSQKKGAATRLFLGRPPKNVQDWLARRAGRRGALKYVSRKGEQA